MKKLFLSICAVILALQPGVALAEVPSISDYFTSQKIDMYDPSGTTVNCNPEVASGSSDVPAGGSNAERLFKFLTGHGLTANQAAGIIGNVMQESGGGTFNISPTALNPTSGAYGIIQWYKGRKTALQKYADSVGKPVSDFDMQVNFMWVELNGDYKRRVLDPILATNDLREPTRIWLERYEVPCLPGSSECARELTNRMKFATQAYNAFSGLQPISGDTGSAGNSSAPSAEVCAPGTAGGVTIVGDKAFPLAGGKSVVQNKDIFSKPGVTINNGHPYTAYDILAKPGTQVIAFSGGKVTKLGHDRCGGRSITIYNTEANLTFSYMHLSESTSVTAGQTVKAGDLLGTVGPASAGCGTPHLHIDAMKGERRLGCSRLGCSASTKAMFVDIGPDLYTLYQALPN